MLVVTYWVAYLNGVYGPGGTPSHEPLFSFTLRSTGDILSRWTTSFRDLTHLEWWQNPKGIQSLQMPQTKAAALT